MTKNDVITMALRLLGITAHDDEATADQIARGAELLDSIYDEAQMEVLLPFDLTDIPPVSGQALARLLSADLAPMFSVAPIVTRGQAMVRFLATVRAYDGSASEAVYY